MQEKLAVYVSTLQNILGRFNDPSIPTPYVDTILAEYNSTLDEAVISKQRVDLISKTSTKVKNEVGMPGDHADATVRVGIVPGDVLAVVAGKHDQHRHVRVPYRFDRM